MSVFYYLSFLYFVLYKIIFRTRLTSCFETLSNTDSLISVFRDSRRLLDAVADVSLGLDETEASLDSALWALRLFFLNMYVFKLKNDII